MQVLVVIVNYRTPELVIDCLRSLAPEVERVPGTRAVVVDNHSRDGSIETIRAALEQERLDRWCTLIELPANGGFAQGNNAGIQAIAALDPPELVWLLNSDTVVRAGALGELTAFMERRPEAGIAGGRLENLDGSPRRSCFRFHSPLSELEQALRFGPLSRALRQRVVAPPVPESETPVDWVSGASMMVRRDVFARIGWLDESYFLYYEETDFCLRAARAGIERWYVPQSRVVHLAGRSSGVTGSDAPLRRRPRYWFESRRRYFRMNHGRLATEWANALWLGAYPLGRLWARVKGAPPTDPPFLWWDFLRWNYLPAPKPAARLESIAIAPPRDAAEEDAALGTQNQNPPGMSLWALWREDWETHERDFMSQGFWALAVHRLGNWRMSIRVRPLRLPCSMLYRALYKWVQWTCGISLAYTVKVGRRVHIWHHGGMVVGARSIGDDVHLRQNTTMGVRRRNDPRWMKPVIGDRVDIGAGAAIVGPITIGPDSIIAANTLVTQDVPKSHLAVGVPATIKPIRSAALQSTDEQRIARISTR